MSDKEDLSLNAVRAFVQIAREHSVTRAAESLGITQSSASRHLAVLEEYLGAKLVQRRGRSTQLTDFGRLFADAVSEPLETILFTANRMRRGDRKEPNRLIVRTSLSTFSYSLLIPNLQYFSKEMGGVTVDIVTSLSAPVATDNFDVLLTRDLALTQASDRWDIHDEQLVCVGAPKFVAGRSLASLRTTPLITVTSRPDIIPIWTRALGLKTSDILSGARYDHHYLALPAVATGQNLLVAPQILVADLIAQGLLEVLPGSRVNSGRQYHAYALDRSHNPDLARAFCRWITRLCRKAGAMDGTNGNADDPAGQKRIVT